MDGDVESKLAGLERGNRCCQVALVVVFSLLIWRSFQGAPVGEITVKPEMRQNVGWDGESSRESVHRDYYTRAEFAEASGWSISTIQRRQAKGLIEPEPWMTEGGSWAYAKNARVLDDRSMTGQ